MAATSFSRCSPVRNVKNIPDPYQIYNEAQHIDEWEGENYDGTSVRAGIKVLARKGYLSSYRWAFDGQTAVNHILNIAPVVIGINWYAGMMATDDRAIHIPKREIGWRALRTLVG